MTTYTVLATALARAKERAGILATDTSQDALLTEFLTMSAGTATGAITHYRPFWVSAYFTMQSRTDQALTEADGIKFTGLRSPILSLMLLQNAYDLTNNLTIPPGFEANIDKITQLLAGQLQKPRILPANSGSYSIEISF